MGLWDIQDRCFKLLGHSSVPDGQALAGDAGDKVNCNAAGMPSLTAGSVRARRARPPG
jgi:hypothetical protein